MTNGYEGLETGVGIDDAGAVAAMGATVALGVDPELEEFRTMFETFGARYFTAEEFFVLGSAHHANGPCRGLNRYPPRALWPNVAKLVTVLDAIRERLDAPVHLLSVYRNTKYNRCVGGEKKSLHLEFKAADFRCDAGNSARWREVARAVRSDGVFSGGIGIYGTFVHVDVRGYDADWEG